MINNACPKCGRVSVTPIGDTHYVCNNPDCVDENGHHTQFTIVPDEKIAFPYNQIFVNRNPEEFYRKPYLDMPAVVSE